jgi:hypothetical protein
MDMYICLQVFLAWIWVTFPVCNVGWGKGKGVRTGCLICIDMYVFICIYTYKYIYKYIFIYI